jgi:arylsulfatase
MVETDGHVGQLLDKLKELGLDENTITDALAGKTASPRKEFFYFNDEGSLVALRYNQWKIVFAEQRGHGFDVWQEPFVPLRFPKVFNLRSDPFESANHDSDYYWKWRLERPTCWCRRRTTSRSSWPRSRHSHRARKPAA